MIITVEKEKIALNEHELFIRLGHCPVDSVAKFSECMSEFEKTVSYKFCYLPTDIISVDSKVTELSFGRVESQSLARNLDSCSRGYVLAATLGIGVDRLLTRLSVTSPAKQFITDAIASAAIESLCDYAESKICKNEEYKPRFSPGYGDLPLEMRPSILKFLDAEKQLGITLTNAMLMIPSKSVTAIVGVKDNENN